MQVASAAGLTQALSDSNLQATVLAPDNNAFSTLLTQLNLTADQLIANQDLVRVILSYHLIPNQALTAQELSNGQVLPTADDSETLTVVKGGSSVSFKPSGPNAPNAQVIGPNIKAGKAIVHIIDHVLIPANANLKLPSMTGATTVSATPSPSPSPAAAATATGGAAATGTGTGTTTGGVGIGGTTGGIGGGGVYAMGGAGKK